MTVPADQLPSIVAHRGAPHAYPENSLAGYKAVLNLAMLYPEVKTFMEVDIRTSRDRVCVGLHDAQINRTFHAKGKPGQHDWDALRCMKLKRARKHNGIDFETLKAQEGSDAPLLSITDCDDHHLNDFRAPSLYELLVLTARANEYRTQHGSPVGLCIDLKDERTFDVLAETLNKFYATHPKAEVPLFGLAITTQVSRESLDHLWRALDPRAQQQIYDEPVPHIVRNANLLTDMSAKGGRLVSSALTAAVGNAVTDWHFLGDCDPSRAFSRAGEKGHQLRGNYPSLNDLTQVKAAVERQDTLWVNNAPETMRYLAMRARGLPEKLGPLPTPGGRQL